ncbi:MAG: tetratricopeptide repeat protein [Acidobacteriota bacterium]
MGVIGQHDRALACFNRALDIEPLLLPAVTWRAMVLHLARRHDDSVRQYRQALEVAPDLFRALVELPFPLIALRRWAEALETLEHGESLYGEHPRISGLRGHILGSRGERTAALAVLSRLAGIEDSGFVSGFDRALVWVGLSEFGRAVAELERSYEQQYSWTLFAGILPLFDPLHGNSRYQTLMRKLHLGTAEGRSAV